MTKRRKTAGKKAGGRKKRDLVPAFLILTIILQFFISNVLFNCIY